MHVDDIHGASTMVHEGQLCGFVDFEMSRPSNEAYMLGATLFWACVDAPEQWQHILAGYEQQQGKKLGQAAKELIRIMTPFQRWIRFAWYFGKEEQPDWVWAGNVRQKTIESLVETIERVKSIE